MKRGQELQDAEDGACVTASLTKRPKTTSDVQVARWSDLHYELICDIFKYLPTVQKAECRRVSRSWNSVLSEELSRSTVVALQYSDLRNWQAIFYLSRPDSETAPAEVAKKTELVPEQIRSVIIDFGYTEMSVGWNRETTLETFKDHEFEPFEYMVEQHPHINHIYIYKALVAQESYNIIPEKDFVLECGVAATLFTRNAASVTVLESAVKAEDALTKSWASSEEFEVIKNWRQPWSNMTLLRRDNDGYGEKYWEHYAPLWEHYSRHWPYPPEQFKWLITCLEKLPDEDPIFHYIALHQEDDHIFSLLDDETSFMLYKNDPQRYLKSTVAFCARYVTTFRKDLDFPPPPYPLIWKD